MLKIWGRLNSINVQKVVWCANEADLAFERIDAGGTFGGTDTEAFRRMNPNGLVPVIDDDGFVLWESNSIVRYLAAKYAPGVLCPAGLTERADAERWMDWQIASLGPAMRDAFVQLVRTPVPARDARAIAASNLEAEKRLALSDAHLAERDYLCGAQFTMADLTVGCSIHRWFGLPQAHRPRPHVERWYAALLKRAGARGVLTLPLT